MKKISILDVKYFAFFLLLFVCVSFVQAQPKNKKIVTFKDSYWEVYGGKDELLIKSIVEKEGAKGSVLVTLQQNAVGFSHFLISNNGDKFEKNIDGVISADFDLSDAKEESVEYAIKIVSSENDTSSIYQLKLLSNSNNYWASRGAMDYPNWITVKSNPYINFASKNSVEDWVYIKPTLEEIEYAKSKWGSLIHKEKSNYENAMEIAKSILDELYPHIGTPTDSMYSRPFVQYQRMSSGIDKGFCSNFAHVFIHACNSLGIPARRIHLQKIYSKSKDLEKISVRMGGMHSIVEIFDERLDQWILMDYYLNSLGFYLGKEGPLNALEFGLFLNQTTRRKNLMLHFYDPKTKEEKMIPFSENPRTTWGSYDGKDTEFHYFIKTN